MAELVQEPKQHLALDTDRGSAVAMVILFAICALSAATTMLKIVHRSQPFVSGTIPWQTWLVLAMCPVWFFGTRERLLRIICVAIAIGPLSRVLLWLLKAPADTLIANAAFLRVIDVMLYVGVCVYAPYWFKSKLRYV